MKVIDVMKVYTPRPIEVSQHHLSMWVWDETNNVNYFDNLPKRYYDCEVIKLVAMGDNHIQLTIAPVKEDEQLSFEDMLGDEQNG